MIKNNLQWKIGGEAGFGIMTLGVLFSRICTHGGLKTFAYPEYPSLIRGGHNTYQVFISDQQATSQIHDVHLLVALNQETLKLHLAELADGAAVIYDPADFGSESPKTEGKNVVLVPIEMNKLIKEKNGKPIERNTVALGASFGLLKYPWQYVEQAIRHWFKDKKPSLAESNVAFAKNGYELAQKQAEKFGYVLTTIDNAEKQMVVSGNEAIALGAIQAGLKLFAAYPMTPSSAILSSLAKNEKKYNLVVKHTEDELAAMNLIIGAGFAGARAMTATSGGGFALMTEALGMAGIAEVPVVVIMGMRGGPSTGLPTWTSQGDLRFVLHASHSEFPRLVLAPGDAQECFYLTHQAFNLAEIYQLPVIILVDKYVQESWQSIPLFNTAKLQINRGKLLTQTQLAKRAAEEIFPRYQHTADGISNRALPGLAGGIHIASSYEHTPEGYTTEDETEVTAQNDKRFKKLDAYLAKDVCGPKLYGAKKADVTLIGWGSTKLPGQQVLRLAEKQNISVNYLHFTYLDPLPINLVQTALQNCQKTLCVEGNKLGQFEGLLKQKIGFTMTGHYREYGARPFYPEKILEQVKKIL